MTDPFSLIKKLSHSSLFLDWKKHHSQSYLSHFFCQLGPEGFPITSWEIGYFDPETQKITVFSPLENKDFQIKPADDVFKKENDRVEELVLSKVKSSFEEGLSLCRSVLAEQYPREQCGNGFVILQHWQGKNIWNFTFITRLLKFVNVKIDAETGTVDGSEIITMMQPGQAK